VRRGYLGLAGGTRPLPLATAQRLGRKAGDLQRLMVETRIGSKLTLSVLRADHLVTLEVVPVELA
jgi:hypothetical protein